MRVEIKADFEVADKGLFHKTGCFFWEFGELELPMLAQSSPNCYKIHFEQKYKPKTLLLGQLKQ